MTERQTSWREQARRINERVPDIQIDEGRAIIPDSLERAGVFFQRRLGPADIASGVMAIRLSAQEGLFNAVNRSVVQATGAEGGIKRFGAQLAGLGAGALAEAGLGLTVAGGTRLLRLKETPGPDADEEMTRKQKIGRFVGCRVARSASVGLMMFMNVNGTLEKRLSWSVGAALATSAVEPSFGPALKKIGGFLGERLVTPEEWRGKQVVSRE